MPRAGLDARTAVVLDSAARAAAFEGLGSPMEASRVRSPQRWAKPLTPMETLQRSYVQKGCQQMETLERCAPRSCGSPSSKGGPYSSLRTGASHTLDPQTVPGQDLSWPVLTRGCVGVGRWPSTTGS